jgi:hypothetical protein
VEGDDEVVEVLVGGAGGGLHRGEVEVKEWGLILLCLFAVMEVGMRRQGCYGDGRHGVYWGDGQDN